MAASVLFDAPGPGTLARHRIYTALSAVVLAAIFGLIIWQLWRKDQFASRFWEPFVTPSIIELLLVGLSKTLQAAVFAIAGALLLGVLLGVGKLSDFRLLRWPSWLVVEFFRAVPLLLVIVATWFYFGAKPGTTAFLALVVGLVLYNGAVIAEIFRAGINAVPKGQSEAAYAIGMRKSMVMRIVLIPQAVKIMLPALISQAIVALKDTSLGYAILAPGLTVVGKEIDRTFRNTVQTAFIIAVIYIVMNLLLTWLATWAQKRYAGEKKIEVSAVGAVTDWSTGNSQSGVMTQQ